MEQMDYVRGGLQKSHYHSQDVCQWSCPLCGSEAEREIKTERGILKVVRCNKCSLIRVNPRLRSPESVYTGDPKVYTEEFRMVRSGQAPHHRDKNYIADIALLKKFKPSGNFLDIGTNCGSFLRHAKSEPNWKVMGVEPSAALANLARKWWGLEIVEGFIEELNLPQSHFDIVTMTDVFEHVVNPNEVLAAIRRVMKPDGLLFVKVPNGLYNILKFRMRSMVGNLDADDFDSYEHVLHYTGKTLNEMLVKNGFSPFQTFVEAPVQIPEWHKLVGHYYQHETPRKLAWKTYMARDLLYWIGKVETGLSRRIGYFAPNIGCLARPSEN